MQIEFKKKYFVGIFAGLLLIMLNFYLFFGKRWFWPGIIISITLGWSQFWMDYLKELRRQKEIEFQFVEFVRSLVESVKSGISIPKSIQHVAKKDFSSLNPYILKLASQIELGIPTRKALATFAADTRNSTIKRSVSIIVEAEQSGGDITDILESVVQSVINVKKIKEERKSSTYSQVVQGYIVFYIFITIMLVLQLWLFPKLAGISGTLQEGLRGGLITRGGTAFNMDKIFFSLIMIQGFFAGIMVGKFSEGTLKSGLIHSLVLMTTAALIITTVKGTI